MTTTGMNTLGSTVFRTKFYSANLQQVLRNALVCEKICQVNRDDSYTIKNPYGSQPSTTVSAMVGTYTANDYTVTNDTLQISDTFMCAEQIYDFEQTLSNYDLFANRADEVAYSVATAIDKWVLNQLTDEGTGTYTTPAGGFTTASNIITIMSNLISKTAGYSDSFKGLFLVIENTDIVGFAAAQATNGFSMADSALNNGFMSTFMGVDIYVVRSGTFVSATSGTKTWTNSGHRVFGVKNVATYAAPRGVQYEEKSVSGKTGKEIVAFGYIGFKLWTQKAGLVVDITIA